MASPLCLRHRPDPVAAVCCRCGEGLCEACWTFLTDDKPLCACCVRDSEGGAHRAWSRLVVFIVLSGGLAFWLSRHVSSDLSASVAVTLVVAAIAGVFLTKASVAKAKDQAERIRRREPGATPPTDPRELPAHPYRARLGRVANAPAPTLSARATALVVGCVLVATAVLVPVSLRLPRWVEFEIVLVAWWTVSFGFLTLLLHQGTRLREDHAFLARWKLPDRAANSGPRTSSKAWGGLDFADGCADAEGCAGIFVGVLLAAVAVATAWFVVELVFPALFFLVYWLVVKAIARVTNDKHGCERNVARAMAWGGLWATAYTLPLALVVWVIHLVMARGH